MKNKKNVPDIRFKGFAEEWMQRKANTICSISTGKSNTQDKEDNGIYPFYVRSTIVERSNKYLFDEEAVLTAGDGVGTGKVFHYVNGKYNLHQRVYRMFNFNDVDGKYFYFYFMTNFYRRVMSMTAKSSVDSVRLDMIAEMKINLPSSIAEQISIVNWLSEVDRLINTSQTKLDKLKNIKKACLEKMFPCNGSTTPELRFKGFIKEWENGTLGSTTYIYDGTHQTPNYTDRGIMFLSVENIRTLKSNKYISEEDFKRDFKVYPEFGDVLMTRIGNIGTANTINTNELIAFYVSLALLKKKDLDPYFLKESIHSEEVRKGLWHRTLHIAFPQKINKNEIEKVVIKYPNDQEEQIKIGYFFKNIDDLIAKAEQQIKKLKNIKKACLDKMFVNTEGAI